MANKMRAIAWDIGTAPRAVEVDAPEPTRGEVRVRVLGSALNPADLKVVQGGFLGRLLRARTSPLVVGFDFSGKVDAVGEGVTDLKVGDEVFGHLAYSSKTRQGAFAELITTGSELVGRKPAGLSHEQAAALPTAGLTALQCLRDLGKVPQGGKVLLVGAAGGVGSLALGIGKKLGLRTTAVCSTYAVDFVRGLGADEIVDRKQQDPLSLAGPFDVVFDAPCAHSYFQFRRKIAPGGAYVTTLPNPSAFLAKAIGGALFNRRCEFIIVKSLRKDLELLGAWASEGMKVPVQARYPVRELAAAEKELSKGSFMGRLAIQVEGGF